MIANSHKRLVFPPPPPIRRQAAPGAAAADWRDWLAQRFPSYTAAGFAPRHAELWGWVWGIEAGERAPSFVALWGRGGAKSTTAELSCVAVGERQTRRYGLYVSEIQDQADRHVQTIGTLMERAGFGRAVNKYGSSRGWRRNQLRASNGFKIDAIGLDAAARGAKVDEDRPDYIIIDDVDGKHDTPHATQKKIEILTTTILPAMAPFGVVLFAQNLIHSNSIAARFADGRADFLTDRIVSGPHKAIDGLEYDYREGRYVITGGIPTWAGQDKDACQGFIDTWGLAAFLSECQHDVASAGQYFETWDDDAHIVRNPPQVIPSDWILWGAFDHGFAHNTAFGVFGLAPSGDVYLVGEYVRNKQLPATVAAEMDGLLGRLGVEKRRLREVVAGLDVFQTRGDEHGRNLAEQYRLFGWTFTPASVERINGWSAIRERLGNPAKGHAPTFYVFNTCPVSASQIKSMVHDPKRPEDVLKVDSNIDGDGGDDAADMVRYGIMAARPALTVRPIERQRSRWKDI